MTDGVDESRPFEPVRIAVLTVSDTRTLDDDKSGDLLAARIEGEGHVLADRRIVKDDIAAIQEIVKAWIADPQVEAVISTGGTGVTGRDVTPEALKPLFDKEIEGFAIVFHMVSFQSVGVSTLQSRATAGVAGDTFLFALPGSRGGAADGWDKVIRFELDSRHRPCNLAELMPRLMER
ncbi:MAG: molybdenum cofactor biosynthesis protein B [Pseudomonadota bacterium]